MRASMHTGRNRSLDLPELSTLSAGGEALPCLASNGLALGYVVKLNAWRPYSYELRPSFKTLRSPFIGKGDTPCSLSALASRGRIRA